MRHTVFVNTGIQHATWGAEVKLVIHKMSRVLLYRRLDLTNNKNQNYTVSSEVGVSTIIMQVFTGTTKQLVQ